MAPRFGVAVDVSSARVQTAPSGTLGSVKSIVWGAALRTRKSGGCPRSVGASAYERKCPLGNRQSSSVISAASGVSHKTS